MNKEPYTSGIRKRADKEEALKKLKNLSHQDLVDVSARLLRYHPDIAEIVLFLTAKDDEILPIADAFLAYFAAFTKDDLGRAVDGGEMALERAMASYLSENYVISVGLYLQILSHYLGMLENKEDVGGNIGFLIDRSINGVHNAVLQIAKGSLLPLEKAGVFNMVRDTVMQKAYDKWFVWRCDLLQATVCLCEDSMIRKMLVETVDEIIASLKGTKYYKHYVSGLLKETLYSMAQAFDSEEEVWSFILDNLNYDQFRGIAIQSAVSEADFDFAIGLCNHKKWWPNLFFIYGEMGLLDKQSELARELVLDGSFEYYSILKSFYSKEEWKKQLSEILNLLEAEGCPPIYLEILMEEAELARLSEYCMAFPETIMEVYQQMVGIDRAQAKQLMEKFILNDWNNNKNKTEDFYEKFIPNLRTYKQVFGKNSYKRLLISLDKIASTKKLKSLLGRREGED